MVLSTSIDHEIERPISTVFRRALIKRRQSSDGLYESDWFDITDYVKRWGSFDSSIDDVRFNRFTFSGITLVCENSTGKFNQETSVDSFWNGYLTRYRTLVKIEAGYVQDDGTELPADPSQGIFILDGNVILDATTMEATLVCKSLMSTFEDVRASELDGIYSITTAFDIFGKIRDHTDGAGNFVFRQFITSTAWTIDVTPWGYNLSSAGAIDDLSVWELMNKLAEAEGRVVRITRSGGLTFTTRDPNTTTVAFHIKGKGEPRPNVIGLKRYYEPIDKFFNFYRLKYLEPDTFTSYVTAGTATTVEPPNTSWKYGSKMYEFENTYFANTATAQGAIDLLFSITSVMKNELELDTVFVPHVEISDRVAVTYLSYSLDSASLWDLEDWASDAATLPGDGMNWDLERGEMFNFEDKEFRILSKKTDLDNLTTKFLLREV